jgi:hypothetical protein
MPEVTNVFYPHLQEACLVDSTTQEYVLNWFFDEIRGHRDFSSTVFENSNDGIERWGFADITSSDYGVKRTPTSVFLCGRVKERIKNEESEVSIQLDREGIFLLFECKQLLTEPINRVKVIGRCVGEDVWPDFSAHFDILWEKFIKDFNAASTDKPDLLPSNELLEAMESSLQTGHDIRAAQRREKVKKLSEKGVKISDIANQLGVSEPTVIRDRRELGIATPRTNKEKSTK